MASHCQAAEEKLDGNGDEAQQDQEDESKLSMLSQSLMFVDHDIQFCCIFQWWNIAQTW